MNVERPEIPRRLPRWLSVDAAAAYVGLSQRTFEAEVAFGTFPQPFKLGRTRRRLWDVRALDATMDRASGLSNASDDLEARARAWEAHKQDREARKAAMRASWRK